MGQERTLPHWRDPRRENRLGILLRTLLALLLLAGCSEPERALPSPSWDGMEEPTPDPAANIAAIGAQGLCAEGERPVTAAEGVTVTACEDASPPLPP
jgi:hypothetical protein